MRRLLAGASLVRRAGLELHRQQRPHDGLDARLGQGVGDLIDAEQIVGVGDRDGRRACFPRQVGQFPA